MSVLKRLKAMVKEAQEDIEKSQKNIKKTRSIENKASKPKTQTTSEDKVEKIQKYRKSASQTKTEKTKTSADEKKPETVKLEITEEIKTQEKTPKTESKKKEKIEETVKEEKVEVEETKTEKVKNESTETEAEKTTKNSEEENKTEISEKKDKKSDKMTLLNDNDIFTMDDIDAEFHQKFIDAGVETVDHCFQCGTCGGSCPSGRRTPYRVRKLVRNCLLGLKDEVISDDALWMCTTCYTCQERCPRGVKIVDVVKQARRIASHAGYMAKAHKMTGVFVLNTGHAVPINDAVKEMRTKIGLPELPPTTHSFPEALKEVQDICKACEFDELIGYDEATGGLKE